ncbi:hypothetical protein ACWCOU_37915, partial [Actinomadura luteofluorescens]
DERLIAFWRDRHLCTLVTLRPDGTPHSVPVGPPAGMPRVGRVHHRTGGGGLTGRLPGLL